ncbi:MAG: DegT/DnrJ/EryC1/StrS family aminotransferase [Nitrospirae bacterium]|nr:DegT/DnrJ/EryC1/StrS family aminotransferase [Nitrospirota bacterium]
MPEKLAMFGGEPVRREPYPPYNTIGDEEKKMAMSVLDTGVLSGFVGRGNEQFYGGAKVRELEALFCTKYGSRYAISFNSATSALHGTMIAAGIGPGDEVIVPPYSMSATAAAVLMCHAVPVFIDIEPEMFCLDPSKLEAAVTERTKAVIAVNLFGLSSDMDPVMDTAARHGLIVVEDNAQAPGAKYKGRFTGRTGHMGVFSLNRHKTIQCGEGGVVLTDDSRFAERLQLCRNHGEVVLLDWETNRNADVVGFNYRLSELHAAVAIPQLNKLGTLNSGRISLAGKLTAALGEIDFIMPPAIRKECTHVFYLYPMLYKSEKLGITRDLLLKSLIAEGVHASNYAAPIYRCPIYQEHQDPAAGNFKRLFPEYNCKPDYSPGICPEAELIHDTKMVVTNICRYPHTEKEVEEFVKALRKIQANIDELRKLETGSG